MDRNTRKALNSVVSILSALLSDTDTTTTPAPKPAPQVRLSQGGNVVIKQATGNTTGLCHGCGKAGMVNNLFCRACVKGATKAVKAEAAPVAVDLSAYDKPAKASNKGRKGANCSAKGCSLFVSKGQTECKHHLVTLASRPTLEAHLTAQDEARKGLFVTLEDHEGNGYRIPADRKDVLSLRTSFDDHEVVEIARRLNVGVAFA